MWQVTIIAVARKQIKRFPAFDQGLIFDILTRSKENPFVLDMIKLKGQNNIWRLRVGNYRLHLEILKKLKTIFVFNVERRTSTTY